MKIAFLTPEFPHPLTGSSGGIGTSILNLSKGLIELGHEIVVIVCNQEKDDFFIEGSLSIYKVKNQTIKGFSYFFTQKKIERLIKNLYTKGKIDLLEAPDWIGLTSYINTNCPTIIKLHGSDTYFCKLEERKSKWRNRFREKLALRRANGVIAVSHYTALQSKEILGFKQSFKVIPNAIDVSQFIPIQNTNDSSTILYFGTLIRKKGLLELPKIFNEIIKENSKVRLVLIGKDSGDTLTGNPSVWNMMQELFDESALKNVQYLGEKSYNEMNKYIEKATVCVFPTFAEAFPVSWLEAMAMQKSIVASNIGWASEMIQNEVEGFLVHPKDHKVFADKITLLLNDAELRQKMGFHAREKVLNNFSTPIIAKQSLGYYSDFINSKK